MECSVEYRPYRRPFRRPLRTSRGEWTVREGFVVKVRTPDGTGYGEVAPIPEFGSESVAVAGRFLRTCAGGGRPPDLSAAPACCAFALSSAVAMAREVAGGVGEGQWEVAGLLPAGEAALPALEAKLDSGFRTFKWKIGVFDGTAERGIFERLCERLPEQGQLRLDANGGLGLAEAGEWMRAAAGSERVEYVEQPLPAGEERAMAELAADRGVSVALDESLNGPGGFGWLAPDAWPGPLVVKPALMGEVRSLRERLAPVAERVVFSSVFETDVGLCNAAALLGRLPTARAAVGFDTASAFDDEFNAGASCSRISLSERSKVDLSELWKRLRHSG